MNRLFFAVVATLLTVGCGGANFTGTFDVNGTDTWRYTGSDGNSYRLDFDPSGPATISNASETADYELNVDGCAIQLAEIGGDAAELRGGDRCTYVVDGLAFTEVYRSGVVKVIDDRITVRANGDLFVRTTGGDQQIGTVAVDYTLFRTSEWTQRTPDRTQDRTVRTRTAESN